MIDLWAELSVLALGSAAVPVQIIITILLVRASYAAAAAWVGGMVVVMLAQGVAFGMILYRRIGSGGDQPGSGLGIWLSAIMLVAATTMIVMAIRELLAGDDPDAPPPKWMTAIASVGPGKAFAFGFGMRAIAVKFWIFTLGAISAMREAGITQAEGIVTFLGFTLAALSPQLAIPAVAGLAPVTSRRLLDGTSAWLVRHTRIIMIVVGFGLGGGFLIWALAGLEAL